MAKGAEAFLLPEGINVLRAINDMKHAGLVCLAFCLGNLNP